MKRRVRRKKKQRTTIFLTVFVLEIMFIGAIVCLVILCGKQDTLVSPEELLVEYMNHIAEKEYEEMYAMLNVEASGNISQDDFVKRNSAIYEGIVVDNMEIEVTAYDEERKAVTYQTSFDTVAGNISFENEAIFLKGEDGYELVWGDSMIFPELGSTDKVKISTVQAERGEILDRNGRVLAGKGVASSVGIVPGKLEDRDEAIQQIAELLEIEPKVIEKKLSAQWVKEDSFVPIKTIPKVEEIELMKIEPDEDVLKENERQKKLLEIPGVMTSDTEVREYPLGEAAAHLVGYVQSVTAEDLENHAREGYTANSVMGKSGMEGLFEKELKGQNGCRIYIEDSDGNKKAELASIFVQDGKDIQLTIDADLQRSLYAQFNEDKSCSVAMNPYTGEVLALVSTPSYDNNDFIMGLSNEQWTALNEDENKPMYNRFRQAWCPGSTFKPVIAAIGLESGAIDPMEDYGNEGLSWQKDSCWGSYYVTTLHAYEPVTLENALMYSDNIYFAKAAFKIGREEMESSLTGLGFNDELPFEIKMAESQYSNSEEIETEIQLADSGYGQGQVLVNPLHMACIYSAFCNEGDVIKPYLVYQNETAAEYWIPGAFSDETASCVLEGTKKVVNDSNGTGYAAHREDIVLAGKTGTAEIKASKDDSSGTELGWFAIYSTEETDTETSLESVYWFVPQSEECLITGAEKKELQSMVLSAAESVSEIYADIVISDAPDYSSGISDFTSEQRKAVVEHLGSKGLVSVEEDTYMQNSERIEKFYTDYLNGQDSMITVFEVEKDGLIGASTFICRKGRLQNYYIGVRWKQGGVPEIQGISVSDVAEIKLTEKGYFIYAYKEVMSHTSLRQYWRIKPLSERCRELTEKYISGLSYVNYNMLVVNWDSNNIEEILMPCMFEDIYRIHTGENLKTENWKIPAEKYENIMTTYFPVSVEQLRKNCKYDESSNSYEYEMIYASPYPPFGEVVDYTKNADGTTTLIVDGVWPDYNSDLAFRNKIVVQPFEDGTFRYLSNSIEQIELELPPIARRKG